VEPLIDHIQITVKDMFLAVPFYEKFLLLLGFDNRLHDRIREIGATIVRPPQEYPEYTPPGYYAFYFKDLEGIKYEIVFYPGTEA
jgi:hypothetical protein